MTKKKKKSASQKTTAKASHEDEIFYVGLHNPAEIRRNLLEASRDVVQFLQRNEKIKEIRKEKVLAIQQLRAELHQLRTLAKQLKKLLPKTNLHVKLPKEPEPEVVCAVCGQHFKNQPILDRHMKKHQPKKEPKPKEEKPAEAPKPKPKPQPPHHKTELERLESELNDIEKKLEGL